MNENELKALLSRIRPADSAAKAAAKERQSKLAKPPGSLGALEENLRPTCGNYRARVQSHRKNTHSCVRSR